MFKTIALIISQFLWFQIPGMTLLISLAQSLPQNHSQGVGWGCCLILKPYWEGNLIQALSSSCWQDSVSCWLLHKGRSQFLAIWVLPHGYSQHGSLLHQRKQERRTRERKTEQEDLGSASVWNSPSLSSLPSKRHLPNSPRGLLIDPLGSITWLRKKQPSFPSGELSKHLNTLPTNILFLGLFNIDLRRLWEWEAWIIADSTNLELASLQMLYWWASILLYNVKEVGSYL